MSELTMNNVSGMYDEVEEIRNLNKVEGFDPRNYMRIIQKEGQAGKYYLDVVYRKLWFRLKYPEGKIVKKILKLTDQMAIVEAKVYLSRNDTEDSFISNAMAQKYLTGDDQFGNKFVELAETAAVGRALADAGFGLQFADTEGEADPEVTDAPIDRSLMGVGGNMPMPEGTYMDEELINPAGEMMMDNAGSMNEAGIPGQYGIESYIPTPDDVMQASQTQEMQAQQMGQNMSSGQPMQTTIEMMPGMGQPMPQQTASRIPAQQNMQQQVSQQMPANQNMAAPTLAMQQHQQMSQAQNRPQNAPNQAATANAAQQSQTGNVGKPAAQSIDKKLPVEQIYAMLSRETAASVVVPIGVFKNKTLSQVAIEKPASLDWYITSYGGPDNLLRAAAKFLMDAAMGQAS